jgi:hypothetical protein
MRRRKVWSVAATVAALAVALIGVIVWRLIAPGSHANVGSQPAENQVPGENYQICNEQSKYLTSPWTYDALTSGSQSYTVAQYEALPGYGTKLPPLPSYIASEPSTTEAAVIFAPGSADIKAAAYNFPSTPILYFFEGGSYGKLVLQSISGDEFIGGAASGHSEPTFNDGGGAGGIDAYNDTYAYSGGASALSRSANVGATTVTTTSAIPGNISYITFADGSTYGISTHSGTSITLSSSLRSAEASGSSVWANKHQPIAEVSADAARGATSVTLTNSSIPLVTYGNVVIGGDTYQLTSVSGRQSSYTVRVAGLDTAVTANTPVYYDGPAGGVSVEYLDISNDLHNTTGTISTGPGWMIEHNNIHDSYGKPGQGVAFYGGDEGTIEYNCFSKLGDYAVNVSGTGTSFDYNEVLKTAYKPDPGCGCSGGGKWWGTLNANIVDNAFVEDGIGGGQSAIWLDNGNTGTLIEGNYFYRVAGSAIASETGYDMRVHGNLFLDDGWGNGQEQGSNNDGAVNINSSGGFNIRGSRYENSISVSSNYFINDWEGINIWQAGQRSCENSGEGWPADYSYCSGGFPNTTTTAANGQYYFSHIGDSNHGGTTTLAQPVSGGSSTILVKGAEAIDDQVDFSNPASTTTTDRTNVSGFSGSGNITVSSTIGFPAAGQLRVGTSAAWSNGGGSYTGAILSYTGTTATTFTGVSLVRGSGTLSGPVLGVQRYKVTAEKCYANDCALTVSPPIASSERAGTEVSNAGTCQLYATSVALPSGPLAPDGVSYWDGCQWETRDISVTGNYFVFQPNFIAASAPPLGTATSTVCTASHTGNCGTNFMAYQASGEAPFDTQTAANAMMSSPSFTGCPSWDAGCATNPLVNMNALLDPPGATVSDGERPGNNVWSDNTYVGPWGWYAYLYGGCGSLPTDPRTGKSMPSSVCGLTDFSRWHSDWQQDAFSRTSPQASIAICHACSGTSRSAVFSRSPSAHPAG